MKFHLLLLAYVLPASLSGARVATGKKNGASPAKTVNAATARVTIHFREELNNKAFALVGTARPEIASRCAMPLWRG